jgi:hypothetical protein
MRQGLERYCNYRDRLARCGQFVGQAEVDELLASLCERDHGHLPTGVCAETLDSVVGELCAADRSISLSATELARIMGASRVTTRRYLEYLAGAGLARRDICYGTPGRPEVRYQWRWPRQEYASATAQISMAVQSVPCDEHRASGRPEASSPMSSGGRPASVGAAQEWAIR